VEHVGRRIPGARPQAIQGQHSTMVESLAELADLHDDVEIMVVELLHHERVCGAVLA